MDGEVGKRLLEVPTFTTQRFYFVAGCRASGIARESLLTRFKEFL